jgi:S-adenosylmethionine:tRNA ribosyltransferase-isomerase
MHRSDFCFELPEALIAQHPAEHRGGSRLLHMRRDSGALQDCQFSDIEGLLRPTDLLVFNNTRVVPARFHGHKASGGRIEVMIDRVLDRSRVLAQLRSSHSPKPGSGLRLDCGIDMEVLGRDGALFELRFDDPRPVFELMEAYGQIPLPPYIHRQPDGDDKLRYQTVFARHQGAVAAPTAGLHFDQPLLQRVQDAGIDIGYVTLHVGSGTFAPMRSERLDQHQMHREWFEVDARLCEQVAAARARGGRVVSVGTTVVRSLEAAAAGGGLCPFRGETDIFIYPGYEFRVVDALLTNFHLSESTLLMLVCAFAGREAVLAAYNHAVQQRYRFFSYGDAMFLS